MSLIALIEQLTFVGMIVEFTMIFVIFPTSNISFNQKEIRKCRYKGLRVNISNMQKQFCLIQDFFLWLQKYPVQSSMAKVEYKGIIPPLNLFSESKVQSICNAKIIQGAEAQQKTSILPISLQ